MKNMHFSGSSEKNPGGNPANTPAYLYLMVLRIIV